MPLIAIPTSLVSGCMFGTSGFRGPVGSTVTATLALRIGRAVGTRKSNVVVGRDVRDSGEMLANAFVAGAQECGATVTRIGVVSTPTVARSVEWFGADVGVAITGSHNSAADNGIKLWSAEGRAFDREAYRRVVRRLNSGSVSLASHDALGGDRRVDGASERHVDHLVSTFDSFEDLSVVVDVGNGAGRVTADALYELGCDVMTLNGHEDGRFPGRGSEPTEASVEPLSETVAAVGADLGLAHDCDADRTLAVDETGRFVPGDELLALFAQEAVVGDGPHRVVAPVNASRLVDDVVGEVGGEVVRTPVGDTYVASRAVEPDVAFGGEPCGAWIWPEETLCPDGHYAACRLADYVADRGPLSTLTEEFDAYAIRHRNLDRPAKHDVMADIRRRIGRRYENVDTTDGVRVETDRGWFLIRASGTEPLVRVSAEARTAARADEILAEACSVAEVADVHA